MSKYKQTLKEYIDKCARLFYRIRIFFVPHHSPQAQFLRRLVNIILAFFQSIRDRFSPPEIYDDFDEAFYVRAYPDILLSGIDPYHHYQKYGKNEGRLGVRPIIKIEKGFVEFDPSRDTILVVSHEASRTGAPILSYNLTENLKKKYNVVSLLLDKGSIHEYFFDLSVLVVGPLSARRNRILVDDAIEHIVELFKLKFAIVNSVESYAVVQSLAKRFVPAVTLIHEFAAYTRPKSVFLDTILWSYTVVFSASVTYDNAISEYAELKGHSFPVIPQGLCIAPSRENDLTYDLQEEAKVLGVMRPIGLPKDVFVVVGLGSVHIRKGVDLFLECANRVVHSEHGERCRFIWIGKGFNPESDMDYSIYLLEQIRRSGLEKHVFFMDETSNLEAVYKAADVLLIPSRLDPLPNVAIDAMIRKLPLICFDKTTGIADVLTANGLAQACVAPYIDTMKMSEQLIAFAQSEELRHHVGEQLRQVALKEFDMPNYTSRIENIALAAVNCVVQEQKDVSTIQEAGLVQLDFFLHPHVQMLPAEIPHYYVKMWMNNIRRRKLFPGFHPGIFAEQYPSFEAGCDPLASYLRAGRPAGPWQFDLITPANDEELIVHQLRVALHFHVYYPDLLPDMLERLNKNEIRPDLFISVPTQLVYDEIQLLLAQNYSGKVVEIQLVPNRGRDIGPFLTAFGAIFAANYDVVGHLHTKKTADIKSGDMAKEWHAFLLENLLGGMNKMADIIIKRFASDPSVGIIFPDDPNVVGWDDNKPYAEAIAQKLELDCLPQNMMFPVGTMFWARVDALLPLFDLSFGWEDYPSEPIPYDGSILHALERLLPFVVSKRGFRAVLTNVMGVTR